MTASDLILVPVIISVLLIVFAVGARASLDDALYLFRRPALLLRSMAALYIVVPAFAVALCLFFNLSTPVKFALIALSVSPIPPVLPGKQFKSGGDEAYVIGLLVAASLFALVVTPLLVLLTARIMGVEAGIPPLRVARSLLISVGIPLAAGMLFKAYVPKAADAARKYATTIGAALLAIAAVAILIAEWRAILGLIGDGSVLAIAATVGVGLLAGHLLEGGSIGRRTSLALAAATRHPGVAITIATLNFPTLKQAALAAILLFFIVNVIVSIPYLQWTRRRGQSPGSETAAGT